MKQFAPILFVILLITNVSFSQNATSQKPVKKVVTSKITKDPKTGKVVKTITTVTTHDVVLDPGHQVSNTKPAVSQPVKKTPVVAKQPVKVVAKKPVAKPKVVVVAKKPAPAAKVIAAKPKPAVVPKEDESGSIFSNPADNSAKNVEKPVEVVVIEEKSEINTPYKASNTVTKTTATEKPKTPTKVFKESKSINHVNKTYLGIRGGANFAKVANVMSLTSLLSTNENYKIGLTGGVFLNHEFSKVFSIQPEVNFSQQGYDISDGFDSETLYNQAINLPILLKVAIGGSRIKGFVNAGPYAGYLLNSKTVKAFGEQKVTNYVDFDQESGSVYTTNRVDYGAQAGAGIQVNLGGPKLELEARYNYGFADPVTYTGTKPSYIGETGRNRILTGTIGLMFPLGRK
jgi:Outer membrane protein beta-barrel domain